MFCSQADRLDSTMQPLQPVFTFGDRRFWFCNFSLVRCYNFCFFAEIFFHLFQRICNWYGSTFMMAAVQSLSDNSNIRSISWSFGPSLVSISTTSTGGHRDLTAEATRGPRWSATSVGTGRSPGQVAPAFSVESQCRVPGTWWDKLHGMGCTAVFFTD